jgi:hypothetical protein
VQLSLEDQARIFRVLSSLIGGGSTSQVSKPISPEHETTRWLRLLGPRLEWIEGFIAADPSFFGPGARDYPGFDTSGVLRGDLATEAAIAHRKVQSGIWLLDEARAKDGLPPLPGGLGKIPQIVPVGGQANPLPTPPAADPADPQQATRDRDVRVELRQEPTQVDVHVPAPNVHVDVHVPEQTVHVEAPVEVHVPEQPAPNVHVEVAAPEVHVDAPVEVHVPKQPAPKVTVEATIEQPPRRVTFERNGQGALKGATVEDT